MTFEEAVETWARRTYPDRFEEEYLYGKFTVGIDPRHDDQVMVGWERVAYYHGRTHFESVVVRGGDSLTFMKELFNDA